MRIPHSTRALATLGSLVLALSACGGDDEDEPGTTTATETATATEPPTATTGEPPGARRGPPPGTTVPEDPLPEAGATYRCDGKELRALEVDGPLRLSPTVVSPGERFTVTITDPAADQVVVSLTGVSDVPIFGRAERSGGTLRVALRMPKDAACGNKLVTAEGDISAQVFVAVGD